MKRRDAIKTAVGAVLGAVVAPLAAKAAASETVHLDGVPIETVPKMDTKIYITHTFQLKQRPHVVFSDYR